MRGGGEAADPLSVGDVVDVFDDGRRWAEETGTVDAEEPRWYVGTVVKVDAHRTEKGYVRVDYKDKKGEELAKLILNRPSWRRRDGRDSEIKKKVEIELARNKPAGGGGRRKTARRRRRMRGGSKYATDTYETIWGKPQPEMSGKYRGNVDA